MIEGFAGSTLRTTSAQDGDLGIRVTRTRKRYRLWELDSPVHCAVIGTCLSVADLRRFARRQSLDTVAGAADYEIHCYFVSHVRTSNPLSRLVDGQLNAAAEGAFRRIEREETAEAQAALWTEWVATGRIGPAFWAFMAWSGVDPAVRRRVYGELHMLSHLHGHSAHLVRKTAAELERRVAELEERVGRDRRAHDAALRDRDRTIASLRRELAAAQANQLDLQTTSRTWSEQSRDKSRAARRIAALRASLARSSADIARRDAEIAVLREHLGELTAAASVPTAKTASALSPGVVRPGEVIRRVAYIGGRTGMVPRLRAIASSCSIEFDHHDGGIENNFQIIERIVRQADCLMCPIDCVSHRACRLAKELCRKHGKPFVPLRNSSGTCFARAIGADGA
jgi:hypothetical protein